MRAQVLFIKAAFRNALGRLGIQRRAPNKAALRQQSVMQTGGPPGARTPTDNDLEKMKLWSGSNKT